MKRVIISCLCICLCSMLMAQSGAKTKIVAHRGYWTADGSAQNSLKSFELAAKVGCFASEIDVWYTKDNKLVVNHDRVYQGVNMVKGTSAEILKIELPNGETIPSLESYLKEVQRHPNIRLVYEAKSLGDFNREDEAAELAVNMLREYGLLERTDFICFSINYCLAFKKLLPDARIYYLNGDLAPKSIKKLGFTGFDYSQKVMKAHPEWVAQAHELGLEVNVYTVNSEEDMRYFIDLGVDYITTDYPERLQKLLKK